MKIYIVDYGWEGALTIVAENEEQAKQLVLTENPHTPPLTLDNIKEFDIVPGIIYMSEGN